MIINVNKISSFVWYVNMLFFVERKQVYTDAIKTDESLLNDIERRLTDSKNLSDQEEILQILQKHIPSSVELRENVN